ncbi:MAG: phosphatase PAP2-related protein [Saprospiraceae bacterium]
MSTWSEYLATPTRTIKFALLAVISISTVATFSKFMIWNETRTGININDPLLNLIGPYDLTLLIGLMTNLSILIGLIYIFKLPINSIYFFLAAIVICLLRASTLYFVVLEPPINIIPLKDPIIESLFYGGSVLQKDLFFSGHTANIIIIGLLSENIWLKRTILFIALIVGTMLVLQHVHYSVDVILAPVFAILAYKVSIHLGNILIINDLHVEKKVAS